VASWRTGGLAGRLCPNADLGDGRRLDDELGTGFALLTTASPGAAERALIFARGARLHEAGAGTAIAEWLRRGRATAVVVRPDRTVMRAGRHLPSLCRVLPDFDPSRRLVPSHPKGQHISAPRP
jgi:3-(3-hydroxy-phenyl)propionate hydroxylase